MKQPEKESPFFVGYLDMPKVLKKFYWLFAVITMTGSLLAGYTLANAQKSTPPASWDTTRTETVQGLLQVNPYPVLHRMDPDNAEEIQSILLVGQGKFSADGAATPLQNKMVTVTGFPIRHGGWTMLEIASDSDIRADESATETGLSDYVRQTAAVSLGVVDLLGEVVDSKCYLGVMKPGEGLVHKACAEVCLLGGMPTMLVIRGDDQLRYGYILTHSDGSSVSPEFAALSAKQHQVKGELMRQGDLLYIRMHPESSTASSKDNQIKSGSEIISTRAGPSYASAS